jgi:hypothetical protein
MRKFGFFKIGFFGSVGALDFLFPLSHALNGARYVCMACL